MANFSNLSGTTVSTFKIGKGGITIHQGASPPGSAENGDFWFNTSGQLHARISGSWQLVKFDNISISGNTISSTDTNGNIILDPDGTGNVNLGNFSFDADQTVGASQDDFFLRYDHSTGLISLEDASGLSGGISALWKFGSSTTNADPGNGNFRLNNALISSATQIYISTTTDNNVDLTNILALLDTGDLIYIQNVSDSLEAGLFEISGSLVDNTTYFTIPVTYLDSGIAASFTNNRRCGFVFTRNSNTSTTLTGDVTGTGSGTISTTIADEAVTLAKIQHIATDSFLGRTTAATGDVEVLTATQARAILNVADGADTGTVTSVSAGDGMDFTAITATGTIVLGTPGTITSTSTNAVTATSHTHSIDNASLTVAGIVELATVAETNTGTDATRAVTPDGLDGWAGSAQITTVGTLLSLQVDNININSNTISSTDTNGNINITPDGSGSVVFGTASATSSIVAADNADAIIEAGAATTGFPGADLFLRGGDGTAGTGVDGNVIVDQGNLEVSTLLSVGNITIDANTISSTNTNGNVIIDPNGTGNVQIGNFTFDADQTVGAGQDNYVLTYDNSTGLISLEAASGGGGAASQLSMTSSTDATLYPVFVGDASNTDQAPLYDADMVYNATTNTLTVQSISMQNRLQHPASAANAFIQLLKTETWGAGTFHLSSAAGMAFVADANNSDTTGFTWRHGSTTVDGATEVMSLGEDGLLTVFGAIDVDNLNLNGNTISSTDTNGNVIIDPNGTGNVQIGNFTFDADQTVGAGQDNYVLTYDNSSGLISLEAASGGAGTVTSVGIIGNDGITVTNSPITTSGNITLDLGAITPTSVSTGAFTSNGIDDNCSQETLELGNNTLIFRSDNRFPSIFTGSNSDILRIYGGSQISGNPSIELIGQSAVSNGGDITFNSSGAVKLRWDNSATRWDFDFEDVGSIKTLAVGATAAANGIFEIRQSGTTAATGFAVTDSVGGRTLRLFSDASRLYIDGGLSQNNNLSIRSSSLRVDALATASVTEMVTVDTNGDLSSQAIPSGGGAASLLSMTSSTDATLYPVFVGAASNTDQAPLYDAGIVYNGSTNTLTVSGNITIDGLINQSSDTDGLTITGGTAGANIELYGSTNASFAGRAYYDASQHNFRVAASSPYNSTYGMYIPDSGRVGIGAAAAPRQLTVAATQSVAGTFNTTESLCYLTVEASGTTGDTDVGIGASGDSLILRSGATNHVTMDSSGNIVNSAAANIVTGDGDGAVGMTINDGGGNSNITFNHADTIADVAGNIGRIAVNTDSTTGASMDFYVKDNAATGTVTLPTASLELKPTTAEFFGNEIQLQNDGDGHFDGNVFAFSTTTSSDIRLKKDLTIIDNPLDIINSMNGYTYTMKKNNDRKAGLIAQEVETSLPEAVYQSREKDDGTEPHKMLDYNAVIGVLVEGVKELSNKYEKAREEIEELRRRLN